VLSVSSKNLQPKSPPKLPFSDKPPPTDWVALAQIGAPIGLSGAVRIHTLKSATGLSIDDSLLVDSRYCWISLGRGQWIESEILECSPQTRGLKLRLNNIESREQAELLKHAAVGLSRSEFPPAEEDENYWADLIGCSVMTLQGQQLGEVISMQTNGEHDWLVLAQGMIPFVDQYIHQVDVKAKRIVVDWDSEWFK
jgi:16S rRNA processing protein RimM